MYGFGDEKGLKREGKSKIVRKKSGSHNSIFSFFTFPFISFLIFYFFFIFNTVFKNYT